MPIKTTKSTNADTKTNAAKTPAKTTKTASTTKPMKAETKPAAKTTTKTSSAAKSTMDARESNRLRQQRFLEKHREEINEKRRDRYAERKDGGLCPRCGKKLKSSKHTLCKDCLEKARDYNQR